MHYMQSRGGHMNDSPVGVSSAFRDRRGRAWQGSVRQGIKHPKPGSTHVDQKDIYLETVPRLQLLCMWKES